MKTKILIILFFVLYFLFFVDSALAIGIGAKPSFLDLELKVDQSDEVKILVYNISKEAGIFQIFPDELKDWIKITPDNFRLEAGEFKEIKIKILAKEEGKRATNLSISTTPLNRRSFSVSPGLKIPLRLNIEEGKPIFLASLLAILSQNWLWLITGISIICLIGIFLIKYLKKRKKVIAPPENLPVSND